MVVSRGSQIVLPFAFWDPTDTEASRDKGLYELRTYRLRVGDVQYHTSLHLATSVPDDI